MNDFNLFYINTKADIKKAMTLYNKELLEEDIEEIKEALSLFTELNCDGKYLRGVLVALGYKAMGGKDDKYIPLSLAVEVFQTAILIHDDIIDNAYQRRGKKTIPVSYKEMYNDKSSADFIKKRDNYANAMAIVIADIGLYSAADLINKNYNDNRKLLKLYNKMVLNTMKGELLDVVLPFKEEFYGKSLDLFDKVMAIYKMKTAYYSIVGPFILGMTLGGASSNEIKIMNDILMTSGIAYQIKDDILGIYGDENYIGKTNSDIEEYKQTILYAYTMNTEYKDMLIECYGKSGMTEQVREIFEKSGARKYAEDMLVKLFDDTLSRLNDVKFLNDECKNILKEFIKYLGERTK